MRWWVVYLNKVAPPEIILETYVSSSKLADFAQYGARTDTLCVGTLVQDEHIMHSY